MTDSEQGAVQGVAGNYQQFRGSIFAGALGIHLGNIQNTQAFARELNRKSYKQAKLIEIKPFEEEAVEEHEYDSTYSVSRGELVVAEKWRCVRKISFGSTSVVYMAFSLDYQQEAAVKVCNFTKGDESLGREASVYYYLQSGPGIPRVLWYGKERDRHFLVMELLGPNLLDLLHFCDGKFSLKTVCMLAVQIFEMMDWVHKSGYIHRELKPQNFCVGHGPAARKIFLIDFGTAIKHRPKLQIKDQSYIPRVVGTRLKGAAIYDSVGAHYGNEHSFRDDAESVLYMLVHFLIGDLPWRGYACVRKSMNLDGAYYDEVCRRKLTSTFLESTPPEFRTILDHIRSLEYDQVPDFKLFIHLFLSLMNVESLEFDYNYDWLAAKENPRVKSQLAKKKEMLPKMIDSATMAFLTLQMHREQYFINEPVSSTDVQKEEPELAMVEEVPAST